MVKVTNNTINTQWCKNELHFHFTCARAGLEEKAKDVNQLLAIVRRETNIGSEEKQLILTAIGEGEGFRFDVDVGQFAGEEVGYSSHEGSITHIAEGNSLLGLKEVFWELNGCLGIGKG